MTPATPVDLGAHVREIPDFPSPGVVFRDITPLFADGSALLAARDALAAFARDVRAEYVISAEARGFVLGGAIASEAGAGLVVARKPGKLPREVLSVGYELEYGSDSLQTHADAIPAGARVLVHDDVLATGGTATALCHLVRAAGAEIAGAAFVIELSFLGGRERLEGMEVRSLLAYDS